MNVKTEWKGEVNSFKVMVTYLPATNSVPLADPNVEIVTASGISQAIGPRSRFPKVTATASLSAISLTDMTARYDTFTSA